MCLTGYSMQGIASLSKGACTAASKPHQCPCDDHQAQASVPIANGTASPPLRKQDSPARDETNEEYEHARVTFDKTVAGHYRHSKTGYQRVGVLFLTWVQDDMHVKETEVNKLKSLFEDKFNFETEYYEIPSERWQTGLLKKITAFVYEYDSPDCLAIVYYGGHGYTGEETQKFKFAAKAAPDADGDPSVFFSDIRTALRLPACDQFLILDCCYASKAFTREHIGNRKFELLSSAAHDAKCDAPHLPGSFTRSLNDVLPQLLERNPNGFSTAHLFRELYHTVPKTKPQFFDQSRHSYGKIMLRPQKQVDLIPEKSEEDSTYLNITLRLTQNPEGHIMNELASHLQYLPHVSHIRFQELYAPRPHLNNFLSFVRVYQKLKPVIKKMHARRRRRQIKEFIQKTHPIKKEDKSKEKLTGHLMDIHLSHKDESVLDWSSASNLKPKRRREEEIIEGERNKKIKSSTWPPLPE